MLVWSNIFLALLRTASSLVSLVKALGKRDKPSGSPFIIIPVEQLSDKLSSPLQVIPCKINRGIDFGTSPGMYLFVGGAGVGKTREAADLAKRIAAMSGASKVYLAKGYVDLAAPLPPQTDVRRLIVFVDDYDYGFPAAGASSFAERQAAYAEAMVNLGKLQDRLKTSLDIHAFIVTLNTHRLPVPAEDVNDILPQCICFVIPPINRSQFGEFVTVTCQALGREISEEAKNILANNCDGRFDTVATFLASASRLQMISKEDVAHYAGVRQSIWKVFRSSLSAEQQAIYDQIHVLKRFHLPARLAYVPALLRTRHQYRPLPEVRRIVESIWSVDSGKAIVYDGQFGPLTDCVVDPKVVANAILTAHILREEDRFAFQEEAKTFGCLWVRICFQKEQILFFRKLTKWFPRDRYFAFLLAQSYAAQGHHYRAILALYRILNRPDVRIFYSGKRIEIQCHLLLAQLYQKNHEKRPNDWNLHERIEREFTIAATLADMEFPDLSPDDFQLVWAANPKVDGKEVLERDHKELGFQVPEVAFLDSKRLRAMVHHRYASFLFRQHHREYDVLKQEDLVLRLLPRFGEAILYCAMACCKIGNNDLALDYIRRAQEIGPMELSIEEFQFCISYYQGKAMEALGDVSQAEENFKHALNLVRAGKHPNDPERVKMLEAVIDNPERREGLILLHQIRKTSFTPNLRYQVTFPGLIIEFPSEWKVDREAAAGHAKTFALWTIFSSQIIWDSKCKHPIDASVDIMVSSRSEEMQLNAEAYGLNYISIMDKPKQSSIQWQRDESLTDNHDDRLCMWRFRVAQEWPKVGILISAAPSSARIRVNLMYEQFGEQILGSTIEALARKILSQLKLMLNGPLAH